MPEAADAKPVRAQGPIILDLGKRRRKQVRRLRNGRGKLLADVQESIEQLTTSGKIRGSSQVVVVVVREKPNAKNVMMWPLRM